MGHRVRDYIIQKAGAKSPKYKVSTLMKQAENTYNKKQIKIDTHLPAFGSQSKRLAKTRVTSEFIQAN